MWSIKKRDLEKVSSVCHQRLDSCRKSVPNSYYSAGCSGGDKQRKQCHAINSVLHRDVLTFAMHLVSIYLFHAPSRPLYCKTTNKMDYGSPGDENMLNYHF